MRVAFTFVLFAAGAVGTSVGAAQAEAPAADGSLYYVTTLDRLSLVDGELPDSLPVRFAWGRTTPHPYVVLDGPGEAYFASPSGFQGFDGSGIGTLALRIPERRDVTGRLCLEGPDATLVAVRFRVPADAFSADGRRGFLETAGDEYLTLLAGGWPGAAWWRFRAGEIARELGEEADRRTSAPRLPGRSASSNIDDTFALFTGGRAVAENLQLDRILSRRGPGGSRWT
jgi:hypothetical protein